MDDARTILAIILSASEFRPVFVGARKLLLVKQDDEWHAMDAHCPHQGGSLT